MRHINSETIMAYYDSELSAEQAATVREHLDNCETCRRELDSFRITGQMVSALPANSCSIPPFAAIKAGAAAGKRTPAEAKWHIRLHNRIRPLIATTAAVIMILTVLFLTDNNGNKKDDLSTETCMVEQETDAIVQGYDSLPQYYN